MATETSSRPAASQRGREESRPQLPIISSPGPAGDDAQQLIDASGGVLVATSQAENVAPRNLIYHVGEVKTTKLVGDWDVADPAEDYDMYGQDCPGDDLPPTPPAHLSLLGPPTRLFEAALEGQLCSGESVPRDLHRQPFVNGLEELVDALDHMGGNLGSYLQTNVQKLHASKAERSHGGYRQWLHSELPVHGQNGYTSFVDNSAWMANLWLGWTLEFFVELFGQLVEGCQTPAAVDAAYNRSLYKHHNFFQRTAFGVAVKRLPARQDLLLSLRAGEGSTAHDVLEELGRFVRAARPIVEFCNSISGELDGLMYRERKLQRGSR